METLIDIDGKEFSYTPRRLQLREYDKVMACIDAIMTAKKDKPMGCQIAGHVEEGLAICIPGFDPENNSIDQLMALDIFQKTIIVNNNTEVVRKKSE